MDSMVISGDTLAAELERVVMFCSETLCYLAS